jgi:hypothetical protein
MFKRIAIVASLALAAVALAVPTAASAQQLTWTHDHVLLGENDEVEQHLEGRLKFAAAGAENNNFSCVVTVTLVAEGEHHGTVTKFEPTTETCIGEGAFTGCTLTSHNSDVPWTVETTGTSLRITDDVAGDMTVQNVYHGCALGIPGSHLDIGAAIVTPDQTGEGTTIETATVTAVGVSTPSTNIVVTGELHLHEGGPTLGLQ